MRASYLSSLLALGVVACGEVQADDDGSFTLQIEPDDFLVRQGTSIDLDVTVARTDFDDDIVVSVADLPAGVTAASLTIAGDATTGTLTLDIDESAAQGAITLDVDGASGDATSNAAIDVLIGGAPGTLDQSFGDGGTVVPTLGTNGLVGRGAAIDEDGRIVVTGIVFSAPTQAITLRMLDDGSLDPAYGNAGFVSTGSGVAAQGIAVATTTDAIFVAGVAGGTGGGDTDFGLFRYTLDGALDDNFGVGGIVSFDPGPTQFASELRTLVLAPDGSLVVSGQTFPAAGGVTLRALRYSLAGVRDTGFNVAEDGNVWASAVQDDGKVVFSGMRDVLFWLGRFQATGAPDNGFGSGGQLETTFAPANAEAFGLAVLPDGKVLAVGIAVSSPMRSICLARYNSNGSIDVTFGSGGKVVTTMPFDSFAPSALRVIDDKLLVVGKVADRPAVARLNADGTPDDSFGVGGVATIDFNVAGTSFTIGGYGLALDFDGRIVISAELGDAPNQRLGVARLWP